MTMRSFSWLVICAGILCAWQASAQLIGEGVFKTINSAAGFQGPGDITSGAIAFYSAGRAYNASYAAAQNPLADIVDTTTGLATCTIKVGTNGFANLSAVVCPTASPIVSVTTFCTITHVACSITKLYDQTGTGNHVVQTTLANMPGLTLSAQNGLPCAAGASNSGLVLATASSITQSVPFSFTGVAMRVSAAASNSIVIGDSTNLFGFTGSTANSVFAGLGGTEVILTAADGTSHAMLAVASSTDPLFAVDSSVNTSTSSQGTTGISTAIGVLNRPTGSREMTTGFVCEAGIWPADLNSSYQAMLANMRSAVYGWNF